jgi:succinoglycan biosynthesis protein ExoO
MPVWRPRREWFLLAVRSVLAQEDCNLELILVDDGSPEPAADLLGEVRDSRLRLLRIPHGGPYHARNVGIEAARGEFVQCGR